MPVQSVGERKIVLVGTAPPFLLFGAVEADETGRAMRAERGVG